MHRVFISYASANAADATRVRDALENAGVKCWMAPRDIQAGEDWSTAISRAIESADAFLLVYSAQANASKQVARELHLAQRSGTKTVVPLKVDAFAPEGAFAYLLSGLHWIDGCAHGVDAGIPLVVDHMRRILSNGARPNEQPEAPVEGNIPPRERRLIGRDAEIEEAQSVLAQTRFVTVTGPGGVGKTSFALELVRRAARAYDAAYAVLLAPLQQPELVLPAVYRALCAEGEGAEAQRALERAFAEKRHLVVLDNCEHVLAGARDAAAWLSASGAAVVCTSRQTLAVAQERAFPLAPLAAPAAKREPSVRDIESSPAAQLFLERAAEQRAVNIGDAQARCAIAEICRRLDGVPLAIELAAARVKVLSPLQIVQSLEKRFKLLASSNAQIDERQRTLLATIAWSYDLLAERERRLLLALSAFSGRFSLSAVTAAVRAIDTAADELEIVDCLQELQERSLLGAPSSAASEQQYTLLESIRAFARERAAEEIDLDAAAAAVFGYVRTMVADAQSSDFGRVDASIDVVRDALQWAVRKERALDDGAQLLLSLGPYWLASGRWTEGQQWFEVELARGDLQSGDRVRMLLACAAMAFYRDDYKEAIRYNTQALEYLTEPSVERARALNSCAMAYFESGDPERAESMLSESFAIVSDAGNANAVSLVRSNLGLIAWQSRGDLDAAIEHYTHAVSTLRETGPRATLATCLGALSEVYFDKSEYPYAIELATESLEIFRELRNDSYIDDRTLLLARYHFAAGNGGAAEAYVRHALEGFLERDEHSDVANCALLMAEMAIDEEPERAARLLGFSIARRARGQRSSPRDKNRAQSLRDLLQEKIGAAQTAMLLERGAAMPQADLITR